MSTTQPKWTPGPWTWTDGELRGPNKAKILMTGVALPSADHPRRGEAEANAALTAAAPRHRQSWYTRAERQALGKPVCLTPACPRSPSGARRGLCRRCYDACPDVVPRGPGHGAPRQMGDPVMLGAFVERSYRDAIHQRAEAERISASEWVRRAIAAALAKPSDASEKGQLPGPGVP